MKSSSRLSSAHEFLLLLNGADAEASYSLERELREPYPVGLLRPVGGVKAFGVMGLFIGPVVLSVTLVVLQMLREQNLDRSTA